MLFKYKTRQFYNYFLFSMLWLIGFFVFINPSYLLANIDKIDLSSAHQVGEVLVKLKNSQKIYQLKNKDVDLVKFIQENSANSSIEYIEPNYLYHSVIEPNDTYYTQQLHLASTQVNKAWNYSTGNPSIIIAVIDSGVDIDHPDLRNNIWHNFKEIPNNGIDDDHNGYIDDYDGWDFVDYSNNPRPKFDNDYSFLGMNHGTIISGVIAAEGNNGIGISGVTWRAKIMALRVLNGVGSGNTLNVAKAIDYAIANGASIINLSFVGSGKSTTLEQAIQRANQAGVLVVAAAGNEVDRGIDMAQTPQYPVCHDGGYGNNWVIGVASIDKNERLASFSNYGKCVDVVAPGVGIFSTLYQTDIKPKFTRQYGGYWSGTSVSAPQITGLAALIKSLKPRLTLSELKNIILTSTDNIDKFNRLYINKLGRGKINALKAVMATQQTVSHAEYTTDNLIISPGITGGAHIKVYSNYKLASQFFTNRKDDLTGSKVYSYDFDRDGRAEIVTCANKGDEPWVKIYDSQGNLKNKFLAFDKKMKSGINVAVGDLNNDFNDEIVVVAENKYEPLVKIFDTTGNLKKSFYAVNKFFKGGLSLAIADVNHDNFDEIIIGTGAGTPAMIKIFNYQGQLVNQFLPYSPNYMNGVTVTAGDVDGDKTIEIITGTRHGGGPQIRIFNWSGKVESQFFAYNKNFYGGVNVTCGDLDGDKIDEIITGAGPGGGPHVRIFNSSGKVKWQFFAYNNNFHGGVYVASGK